MVSGRPAHLAIRFRGFVAADATPPPLARGPWLAKGAGMDRSFVAVLLAPLALVLACGGDDGSAENGLFLSFGGQAGKTAKDLFDVPDDEEAPVVEGGSAGKSGTGSAGKAGTPGKGGAGAKGGAAGQGGATNGKGGATVGDGGTQAGKGGGASTAGSSGKGGVGGSTAAGGAGSAASKGGSGGAGSATGKGGSSGKAGSGGAASKGGSSGSTSGDPYAGAIVPSTCEETHGSVGCCGPDNRAYYIDDDGSLAVSTCTGGKVCGWRADKQWYACVDAAVEDPSGEYPLVCGGAPIAGACEAGGSGSAGASGSGGAGGTSSTPPPGSEWTKCVNAWDCLSGLVCSAGYCQKPSGSGAGSSSGSSCQSKGGYGGLGCTGQFVLGCQQIGCGCCESGGIGQCC